MKVSCGNEGARVSRRKLSGDEASYTSGLEDELRFLSKHHPSLLSTRRTFSRQTQLPSQPNPFPLSRNMLREPGGCFYFRFARFPLIQHPLREEWGVGHPNSAC